MVRDPPPQGCEYKILAWAVDPKPDTTKRLKQSLLNFKVDHTYCLRGMTVRCLCSNPLEDPAAPDIQIRNLIYSDFDEALATTAPRLLVETARKDRATLKMSQRKGKPEQEPLHAQLWRSQCSVASRRPCTRAEIRQEAGAGPGGEVADPAGAGKTPAHSRAASRSEQLFQFELEL